MTLHLGFPRSFSSLWQQAGRAGRSGRSALSILICHDSPVDQFFVRNPSILLRSPPESATLNPDNMHVLRGHLLCAAKEIPLNSDILNSVNNQGTSSSSRYDYDLWGPRYLDTAASLMETQDIIVAAGSTVIDGTLHSEDGSMSLPLFASLPVWRMHPLHRLGSSPARDVSLRLIDPITISVSICVYDYFYDVHCPILSCSVLSAVVLIFKIFLSPSQLGG